MALSSLTNVAVKPFNYARNSFNRLSKQNKAIVVLSTVSSLALLILDANRALKIKAIADKSDLQLQKIKSDAEHHKTLETPTYFDLPTLETSPLSWKFVFSYWPARRLEKIASDYLVLTEEIKKVNEQVKSMHSKLKAIQLLQDANKQNISIIHQFLTKSICYDIEILNDSSKLGLISYLSKTFQCSLEIARLRDKDKQTSSSYQKVIKGLDSTASTISDPSVKESLKIASEACRLLEKLAYPIESLLGAPQVEHLEKCMPKLLELANFTLTIQKTKVAKAITVKAASLAELEQSNHEVSQRLDEEIAPLFTELLKGYPIRPGSATECEYFSLTPVANESDVWEVLKRFFLLKISHQNAVATPVKATENILQTSKALARALFYLKHPELFEYSASNKPFFKGQQAALLSQQHIFFMLVNPEDRRELFSHFPISEDAEQRENSSTEPFLGSAELGQNFDLIDLFLNPDKAFTNYELKKEDLTLIRMSELLWAPHISPKHLQVAVDKLVKTGGHVQILLMRAHLQEFYPKFTPSEDMVGRKVYLEFSSYLNAAKEFITEKEKAAIEKLPLHTSRLRAHVDIITMILYDVIPFLNNLTYPQDPTDTNPLTRSFQLCCFDSLQEDKLTSNTLIFMLHLTELKNGSAALKSLMEHYIKPKLGNYHPSLAHLEVAFQWVQGVKLKAQEQRQNDSDRETANLDEHELFDEIKSAVASPIRSQAFVYFLDNLSPLPNLAALDLLGELEVASRSQYTIDRLEEDAVTILDELKGLTDNNPPLEKLDESSSDKSSNSYSNTDSSFQSEETPSILGSMTDEDEKELLHVIKQLIIEHIKKKSIENLSVSTQRVFEAILSQIPNHFFYYKNAEEGSRAKTHLSLPTKFNSCLTNSHSTLFRALLRFPIQELYKLAKHSSSSGKELLTLEKIAPSFDPNLAEAITGIFEGVLGSVIVRAVSPEEDAF